MREWYGNKGVKEVQLINSRKNKYAVRWNFRTKKYENGTEDENDVLFCEEIFDHKPNLIEIKETINTYYNEQINEQILSGCRWEGNVVWLSQENQLNYKTAFDTAYQTDGQNLPVIFKLGTEDEPKYVQFDTVERLKTFHLHWTNYITSTLRAGWQLKDSTDWTKYEI